MATIAELTEDAYDTAVEAAIDLVREKHPDLDLRAGTAVRSLVVEPGALLDASQRDTVNRLRTAMSLESMSRETTVPREDAEAVLSNFGITLGGGTKASGFVRVNLISPDPVTIREGVTFTTEDSVSFIATKTVYATVGSSDGASAIISSNDGKYYFTVPVEASEVGASGNIRQGHALSTSVMISNYSSAEAFSDFSGGEDGESVAEAVARIPAALAYRGMTNELSVRAQISAAMSDPSLLRAVSCVGHRNKAQLRDKHNPLGISVGGRVDVYARLFDAPGVVSIIATGVLVEEKRDTYETEDIPNTVGKYAITLPDLPGFYAIKFIGPANQPDRQGSLQYTLERNAVSGATDDHDFDTSSDCCEIAWSAYQGGQVIVEDSEDGHDYLTAMASGRPAKKDFKVDIFWTDGIKSIQQIIDGAETRNVAADYVVRTPAICLVSMNASVRMKSGVSTSAEDLGAYVEAYINGRSFVPRITRSELANVLLQHGVESVDLSDGGMYLGGRVCGADGAWYYVSGDSLDMDNIAPERAMVTAGTTVFAAEPGAVQIRIMS